MPTAGGYREINNPTKTPDRYFWVNAPSESSGWAKRMKDIYSQVLDVYELSADDPHRKQAQFDYSKMAENIGTAWAEATESMKNSDMFSAHFMRKCIRENKQIKMDNTVVNVPPLCIKITRGRKLIIPKGTDENPSPPVQETPGIVEEKKLPLISLFFKGDKSNKGDPFFYDPSLWKIVRIGNLECSMDLLTKSCLNPQHCFASFMMSEEIGCVISVVIIPKSRDLPEVIQHCASYAKLINDKFDEKCAEVVKQNAQKAEEKTIELKEKVQEAVNEFADKDARAELHAHAVEVLRDMTKAQPIVSDAPIPEQEAVQVGVLDHPDIHHTISKDVYEQLLNAPLAPLKEDWTPLPTTPLPVPAASASFMEEEA